MNQQYVFVYYYTNGGPVEVLHHHQSIATGVATFSASIENYAAPVFLNGALYAIQTEQVDTSVLYQIFQWDPVTGQQLGLMDSRFITTSSPFTEETMSSTSNGSDLIYFLSGTTLIELNVDNLVAKQVDLEPGFDPIDNLVQFFGLEFKRDEGLVIAMKNTSVNMTTRPAPTWCPSNQHRLLSRSFSMSPRTSPPDRTDKSIPNFIRPPSILAATLTTSPRCSNLILSRQTFLK